MSVTTSICPDQLDDAGMIEQLEMLGRRRVSQLMKWIHEQDVETFKGETNSSPRYSITLLQEKENYRLYEIIDEGRQLLIMKAVILLKNSSCREVMELLSSSDEMELQTVLKILHGVQLVGAKNLHTYAADAIRKIKCAHQGQVNGCEAVPQMALQWIALKDTQMRQLVRDFVYLRYTRLYSPESVQKVESNSYGVCVWQSVALQPKSQDIPSCKMKREFFNDCGFVAEDCSPSEAMTRVTFYVTNPLGNSSTAERPAWLVETAAALRHIPNAIINYRIRTNRLVEKALWKYRDSCFLCSSAFNLLRRQHHCRICGASVCSKCSCIQHQEVINTERKSGGTRVCISCLNGDSVNALWPQSLSDSTHRNSITYTQRNSTNSTYRTLNNFTRFDKAPDSTLDLEHCAESSPEINDRIGPLCDQTNVQNHSFLELKEIDEDDVRDNTPYSYALQTTGSNLWPDAPIPNDEHIRLAYIADLDLSSSSKGKLFDALLNMSRASIDCPVAAISIVLSKTTNILSSVGLDGKQVSRDIAIESHTIMSSNPLVLLDTAADPRTKNNPLILSLGIQFYISIPLVAKDNVIIGALSLGDITKRNEIKGSVIRSLRRCAALIMSRIEVTGLTHNQSRSTNESFDGLMLL